MGNQMTRSIIVKADIDRCYELWSNFENFPNFMNNIISVQKIGDNLSHWVMDGPLGTKLEWDAETTRLEKNTRVAWNSRDNGDITTSGQVTFKELPHNETEITVTLQYVPPAGKLGDIASKLFDDPEGKLEEDLRNFKQYAETGTGIRSRER